MNDVDGQGAEARPTRESALRLHGLDNSFDIHDTRHTHDMAPRAGRRGAMEEPDNSTPPDDTQDEDVDMEVSQQDHGSGSLAQLSKGLVRYALACEYARRPIRRQDVNEKGEDQYMCRNQDWTDRFSAGIPHSPLQRSV